MAEDCAVLDGQVRTRRSRRALAGRLRAAGVRAEVRESCQYEGGRYIRVYEADEFTLERVAAGKYLVHADADTMEELNRAAARVSRVLTDLGIPHHFELSYSQSPDVDNYIHYLWPEGAEVAEGDDAMETDAGHRARKLLALVGRPDVLMVVGGPVLVGLIAWCIATPYRLWWVACLGVATLVAAGHHYWLSVRSRRWNERAIAAVRAGELAAIPPPREPVTASVAVLSVGFAFALAGLVVTLLDLVRLFHPIK